MLIANPSEGEPHVPTSSFLHACTLNAFPCAFAFVGWLNQHWGFLKLREAQAKILRLYEE